MLPQTALFLLEKTESKTARMLGMESYIRSAGAGKRKEGKKIL